MQPAELDLTTTDLNAGMRLDRLPICSFHGRILALTGAGIFLDAASMVSSAAGGQDRTQTIDHRLFAAALGIAYPLVDDGPGLIIVSFYLVSAIYVMLATGFAMHVPVGRPSAQPDVPRERRPVSGTRRYCGRQ